MIVIVMIVIDTADTALVHLVIRYTSLFKTFSGRVFQRQPPWKAIHLFRAVVCHSAGIPSRTTAPISQFCVTVFYHAPLLHLQVILIRFEY